MKHFTLILSLTLLSASWLASAETEDGDKVSRTGTRLKVFDPVVTVDAEKAAGELDVSDLDPETAAILEAALEAENTEE